MHIIANDQLLFGKVPQLRKLSIINHNVHFVFDGDLVKVDHHFLLSNVDARIIDGT